MEVWVGNLTPGGPMTAAEQTSRFSAKRPRPCTSACSIAPVPSGGSQPVLPAVLPPVLPRRVRTVGVPGGSEGLSLLEDAVDQVLEDFPEVPGTKGRDRSSSLGFTNGVGHGDGLCEEFGRDRRHPFGFLGEDMFDHGAGMLFRLPIPVQAQPAGFKTRLCGCKAPVQMRAEAVIHVLNSHCLCLQILNCMTKGQGQPPWDA
jgi:hypothetical protein